MTHTEIYTLHFIVHLNAIANIRSLFCMDLPCSHNAVDLYRIWPLKTQFIQIGEQVDLGQERVCRVKHAVNSITHSYKPHN